mmetsp:Transcript_97420/g.275523  ORF Transcript_97420/g.275523 Transcript_97420/m.275523 type:complete len:203 (+) Transcript_97420:373-981(+)
MARSRQGTFSFRSGGGTTFGPVGGGTLTDGGGVLLAATSSSSRIRLAGWTRLRTCRTNAAPFSSTLDSTHFELLRASKSSVCVLLSMERALWYDLMRFSSIQPSISVAYMFSKTCTLPGFHSFLKFLSVRWNSSCALRSVLRHSGSSLRFSGFTAFTSKPFRMRTFQRPLSASHSSHMPSWPLRPDAAERLCNRTRFPGCRS